jgi:hypothetical protein
MIYTYEVDVMVKRTITFEGGNVKLSAEVIKEQALRRLSLEERRTATVLSTTITPKERQNA